MIPRLLHRVWLGDAPIPDQFEEFWRGWQALNPGWTLTTHGEDEVINRTLYNRLTTWSAKSDLLRYEVLTKHGGVYVDTDFEALRPLDELIANVQGVRAFAAWEDEKRVCTALMGAEANHPAMQALVNNLPGWATKHARFTPDTQTGPVFLTNTWSGRADVTLLPPGTFYPVSYWNRTDLFDGGRPDFGTAYAVHHWGRSWMPEEQRARDDAAILGQPVAGSSLPKGTTVFLVPRKSDGGHRDRVWAWLKPRWEHHFPDARIIEGHTDPFNRAAAINKAAAEAPDATVFVIIDADTWVDPAHVRDATTRVEDYMIPWGVGFKLTQAFTARLLEVNPLQTELRRDVVKAHTEQEMRHLSGVVVVNAKAFREVGGFDERFHGWGFEDTAFIYAMDAWAGRRNTRTRGSASMIHLWHPKAPDADSPSDESLRIFNEYRAARGMAPYDVARDR